MEELDRYVFLTFSSNKRPNPFSEFAATSKSTKAMKANSEEAKRRAVPGSIFYGFQKQASQVINQKSKRSASCLTANDTIVRSSKRKAVTYVDEGDINADKVMKDVSYQNLGIIDLCSASENEDGDTSGNVEEEPSTNEV